MAEEAKLKVEVNPEIITKGVNILLDNAFQNMLDTNSGWSKKNPLFQFLEDAMKERKEEIQQKLGEYLIEVVDSEDFRLAVKSEYTSMLAKAMLTQVSGKK